MAECIKHRGRFNKAGYGVIGHKLAHRIKYCEVHKISLDSIKGLVIMHLCDNPSCVNPKHLKLGTAKENSLDCVNKGRCRKSNYSRRKLAFKDVQEIRRRYKLRVHKYQRKDSYENLAREFGVTDKAIYYIVKGKTYYVR